MFMANEISSCVAGVLGHQVANDSVSVGDALHVHPQICRKIITTIYLTTFVHVVLNHR